MAKFGTFVFTPTITDGGETVVGAASGWEEQDVEFEEYHLGSIRIGGSESKFIAVKGTDVAAETDPVVIPLSIIEGYALQSNVPVDVKIDAAAAGIQCTKQANVGMMASSIEIEGKGQVADVKLIVWGKR